MHSDNCICDVMGPRATIIDTRSRIDGYESVEARPLSFHSCFSKVAGRAVIVAFALIRIRVSDVWKQLEPKPLVAPLLPLTI